MSSALTYKCVHLIRKILEQSGVGVGGGHGGCLCLCTISLCVGGWNCPVIPGEAKFLCRICPKPPSPVLSPPFCFHDIVFRSMHLTRQWTLPAGMKFAGPSLCLIKSLKCQNFKYGIVQFFRVCWQFPSPYFCLLYLPALSPSPRSPEMNFYLYT